MSFVEVKEDLDEPREYILNFLRQSEVKLEIIDKIKQYARTNLGRSEELESIERQLVQITKQQQD